MIMSFLEVNTKAKSRLKSTTKEKTFDCCILKESDLQDVQRRASDMQDKTLNRCIGKAAFMSKHKAMQAFSMGEADYIEDLGTRMLITPFIYFGRYIRQCTTDVPFALPASITWHEVVLSSFNESNRLVMRNFLSPSLEDTPVSENDIVNNKFQQSNGNTQNSPEKIPAVQPPLPPPPPPAPSLKPKPAAATLKKTFTKQPSVSPSAHENNNSSASPPKRETQRSPNSLSPSSSGNHIVSTTRRIISTFRELTRSHRELPMANDETERSSPRPSVPLVPTSVSEIVPPPIKHGSSNVYANSNFSTYNYPGALFDFHIPILPRSDQILMRQLADQTGNAVLSDAVMCAIQWSTGGSGIIRDVSIPVMQQIAASNSDQNILLFARYYRRLHNALQMLMNAPANLMQVTPLSAYEYVEQNVHWSITNMTARRPEM